MLRGTDKNLTCLLGHMLAHLTTVCNTVQVDVKMSIAKAPQTHAFHSIFSRKHDHQGDALRCISKITLLSAPSVKELTS